MKKLALTLMAATFVAASVFGQGPEMNNNENTGIKKERKTEGQALRKLEGNEISGFAKENFLRDFPKASNVQWARVNTFDEAVFSVDGKDYKAFYDYDSHLVGTTTPVMVKDLPAKAANEIRKKYDGYTIEKVLEFHDNDANITDMLLYGTQFEDADNYFAELSNGKDIIVLKIGMNGSLYFFKKL